MGNKRSVFKLWIVAALVVATIAAYAWSITGQGTLSSEARRYVSDRGCLTRPLSAALRAAQTGSECRVARLVVERRDIFDEPTAQASTSAQAPSRVVTFADGPTRIRAALQAAPDAATWAAIAPGRTLEVQFFGEKVSGFELNGRFVPTVGDPSVESSEHSVGMAFIPLAFAWLIGIVALFALSPPRAAAPKKAKSGPKPAPKSAAKRR